LFIFVQDTNYFTLWQKAAAGIAWAKRTFDRYPSAYANMAASKYCKDPNYAKGKKKK
jgi:hypothetical protein